MTPRPRNLQCSCCLNATDDTWYGLCIACVEADHVCVKPAVFDQGSTNSSVGHAVASALAFSAGVRAGHQTGKTPIALYSFARTIARPR